MSCCPSYSAGTVVDESATGMGDLPAAPDDGLDAMEEEDPQAPPLPPEQVSPLIQQCG